LGEIWTKLTQNLGKSD